MTTSRITARPGQILGFRPARCHEKPGLYPIFAIAGASPDGDGSGGGEGQQQGQQGGQSGGQGEGQSGAQGGNSGQQSGAGTGQSAGQQAGEFKWDGKVESLPADVQKIIKDAREDAGKARTTAKEQAAKEERERVLKALGFNADGTEELDPEKLAAQLASKDAQLLQLQLESAVTKVARIPAINADADALLDSRSFATKLADLDPTSKTFDDDVKTLVEAAIKENPKLKLQAQAAGVSGGQFTGGTGEGTGRPTSLGQALQRRAASN